MFNLNNKINKKKIKTKSFEQEKAMQLQQINVP